MTVRILIGDVRARLKELPDESVDCVVTSPPYWGLRDYDAPGQLGLEPSLADHIDLMVGDVFAEVWRVLKRRGTCWVNYGDCYATSVNGRSAADTKALGGDDRTFRDKPFSTVGGVLKAKDLCLMPARFAIAMQEWGWWVRSEIVWHKTNPMPESIKDRPGTAHEKIFLFSKSARYHYDAAAVRTPLSAKTLTTFGTTRSPNGGGAMVKADNWGRGVQERKPKNWEEVRGRSTYGRHTLGDSVPPNERRDKFDADTEGRYRRLSGANPGSTLREKQRGLTPRHTGHVNHTGLDATPRGLGANLRNVWPMATRPFKEAHFATFPPDLPEKCILAGCPVGGLVLDPFGGAGTTGLVADRLGRNAILIELNPEYADMARRRIVDDGELLADVSLEGEAA